jgi:hypothetical protein
VSGEHHRVNAFRRFFRPQPADELDAGHARHLVIDDGCVIRAARQRLQRPVAVGDGVDGETEAPGQRRDVEAVILVVVDNEEAKRGVRGEGVRSPAVERKVHGYRSQPFNPYANPDH